MIVVNERETPFREGLTVHDLLVEMDPSLPMAVVRVNGDPIPMRTWKERAIVDGDEIRVVYMIAGG